MLSLDRCGRADGVDRLLERFRFATLVLLNLSFLGSSRVDPQLQRRAALYLSVLAGIMLVFVVYLPIAAYLRGEGWASSVLGRVANIATFLLVGGLAWYCRTGARTMRQVNIVDTAAAAACGVLIGVSSSQTHVAFRPELTMVLALSLIQVGRSAIVPSTARRTALISATMAIPLLIVAWVTYAGHVPPRADYPQMEPPTIVGYILLWWLASTAEAMTVAHVIYGLRKEVDDAKRLGQYELEEKIGEGGMGQVYRARHAMLRRPTAIKLLVNAQATDIERFEREVQWTSTLTHPNTISIFDYGRTDNGTFYYAMEYLEGLDLAQLVKKHGPLAPERVQAILIQVCDALTEAHELALVHRDIKPANIIVCPRGSQGEVAKVLDFGLVKSLKRGTGGIAADKAVMGTPRYMAPEAFTAPASVDARSDIYAVGAVGYFLLTGRPVFQAQNVLEVCKKHCSEAPAHPSEFVDGVPDSLESLLLRCLAKNPEERPQNGAEMAECLRAGQRGSGLWNASSAQLWWARHRVSPDAGGSDATARTIAVQLPVRRASEEAAAVNAGAARVT